MMQLRTYGGLSFVGALMVIYHAFSSKAQFYPALVHLSTSEISSVLLSNMGLVIMCYFWRLMKWVFLGSLREAEAEGVNEQLWRGIMEIIFAINIFRHDFSVTFVGTILALLFVKALHWIAQKRVEYIETSPTVSMLSHIRIISFLGFILLLDSLFFYHSVMFLVETQRPSASLFFSFEYMILATTIVSVFLKYVFYVFDILMEGQWERKAAYTFYLELICDLLRLSMYMCFFIVTFMIYGLPLHLIRELYETFRNFKVRIVDYLHYRKMTSNMDSTFPDATPQELNVSDTICIICREEMTAAKKLLCGHLFHIHCMRSWLERHQVCPTCRALVVPAENGARTSGRWHTSFSESHQQGTSSMSTASKTSSGCAANDDLSQHTARNQEAAAAAAASVYGRSFVYPSASTLAWSPGYAFLCQLQEPLANFTNTEPIGGHAFVRQPQRQFAVHTGPSNSSLQQFPECFMVPFQASDSYLANESSLGSRNSSDLEARKRFFQHQIEVLQTQIQHLDKLEAEKKKHLGPPWTSDN